MYKIRTFLGTLTSTNLISLQTTIGRLRTSTFATGSKGIVDDGPVKYSKSSASKYKAKYSRTGYSEARLWYEPYVILASLTAFMLYFTVIREENDIDEELGRSLYTRIDGLEEYQLKATLEYNRAHGLETDSVIKRINEIEKLKNIETVY